ncbi:MAG: hypothetical protein JST54_19265 [Deltaproteobacteria bacterium]|nr:hypothetical protein [Deltaproteobacteria bacterium]
MSRTNLFFRAACALSLTLALSCGRAPEPEASRPVRSTSALAITGLFATGVNAAGASLNNGNTDPHYTLSSNDAANPGPNAIVIKPVPGGSGWAADTAASNWIGTHTDARGGNGKIFTYTTTFSLPASMSPSTANITGTWACDDTCTISLNGTNIATVTSATWTTLSAFTIPEGSPFVAGSNTLAFVVNNSGGGITGLQVATISGSDQCSVDSQCATSQFCNTATNACVTKLSNGTSVPTISGHNPALTGTCTTAVGTAVCASGVCDTGDNKCGYANSDGPCTTGTASVCRSGACSSNGTCEPAGGCNVDADCTAGNWCNEATHACTAQLSNGTPIPSDPGHSPTLNGTCTAAAGTLVCASGVCDTSNNECGVANGNGPCVTGSVCQSGACSTNGTCEPAGGCNVDADCSSGNWCDESTHTCIAQLPNGSPIPSDPGHSPTLNGTCSPAAGALVCASGVCDSTNNACGFANGGGPCATGSVCQSGACSTNGTCEPSGGCNVDADCTGGQWCNESTHTCTAQLPNGTPIPTDGSHVTGTCTPASGALVCTSGVCDTTDNACGLADGDGPCTTGSVCRSGACSVSGTCEPASGCNADGDCSSGNWCNESTHRCTPTLADGTAVPTDGSHSNPTLDGTCTTAAGALVCTSGVCDTADNACGYANGDGPCDATSGPNVCRSGACSSNGTCEPSGGCNVDADCTNPATPTCDTSTHTCTLVVTTTTTTSSTASSSGSGSGSGSTTTSSSGSGSSSSASGSGSGSGSSSTTTATSSSSSSGSSGTSATSSSSSSGSSHGASSGSGGSAGATSTGSSGSNGGSAGATGGSGAAGGSNGGGGLAAGGGCNCGTGLPADPLSLGSLLVGLMALGRRTLRRRR